ncbi:MAG TPA: restriction endonuclease [Nitrososphaerales archaeon]|nr:restriction endonuclease [Nitrososphaerales archaeon]
MGSGRRRIGSRALKRRYPSAEKAIRTLEIPVPPETRSPEELLAWKLGSKAAARSALLALAEEHQLPHDAPQSVLAALALTRLGVDADLVAKSLAWDEFEDYCAMAISAAGYAVRRNVRLRKPTRQIDIIAESAQLVLSIDCKHWRRGAGAASLAATAAAQAQRTVAYMKAHGNAEDRAFLPVVLTMVDNQVRVVEGIPVVPLTALRAFLASVSRFDEGFAFISRLPKP